MKVSKNEMKDFIRKVIRTFNERRDEGFDLNGVTITYDSCFGEEEKSYRGVKILEKMFITPVDIEVDIKMDFIEIRIEDNFTNIRIYVDVPSFGK